MTERLLITCTDSMMKQFLEHHVKYLSGRGFEIEIACSEVLGRFSEIQEDLKGIAKIYRLSMQRNPLSAENIRGYREVKRIIEQGHYDMIWTNEPVMGALTRLAARHARKQGTEVIYMAHGFHFYKGAPKLNWLFFYPAEKWLAGFTDKLITINEEDYAFAKRKFPCSVYHIHGVGADSERFHQVNEGTRQQLRKELGLKGKIILNVGELNPNKNQKTAILALKKVLKTYPDACLLIAGKGEEKEKLEALVQSEDLEDKVTFLGYTRQVEKYMCACDVLISCSYREGLGLNVIEAMLCGKPVAASRNRGHNELIREGINGYLADPDDVNAFAHILCNIFSEQKGSEAASLNIAELYTDKPVERELAEILSEKETK